MSHAPSQLSAEAACFIPSHWPEATVVVADSPAETTLWYAASNTGWTQPQTTSFFIPQVSLASHQTRSSDEAEVCQRKLWFGGVRNHRGRGRGRGYAVPVSSTVGNIPSTEMVGSHWPGLYSPVYYPPRIDNMDLTTRVGVGSKQVLSYVPPSYQPVNPSAVCDCEPDDSTSKFSVTDGVTGIPPVVAHTSLEVSDSQSHIILLANEGRDSICLTAMPTGQKKKKKKKKKKILTEFAMSSSDAPQNVTVESASNSSHETVPRTLIYTDSESQTDFPELLSRMTLSDLPNLLYKNKPAISDPTSCSNVENVPSEPGTLPISMLGNKIIRQNRSSSSGFPKSDKRHVQAGSLQASGIHPFSLPDKSTKQHSDLSSALLASRPAISAGTVPAQMSWAMVLSESKPSTQGSTKAAMDKRKDCVPRPSNVNSRGTSKSPRPTSARQGKVSSKDREPAALQSKHLLNAKEGTARLHQQQREFRTTSSDRLKSDVRQQLRVSLTTSAPMSSSTASTTNMPPDEMFTFPAGAVGGHIKQRGKKKKKQNRQTGSSSVEPLPAETEPLAVTLLAPQIDDGDEFPSLVNPSNCSVMFSAHSSSVKQSASPVSYSLALTAPAHLESLSPGDSFRARHGRSNTPTESVDKTGNKREKVYKVRSAIQMQPTVVQQPKTSGKKYRQPITFNFADVIDKKKSSTAATTGMVLKSSKAHSGKRELKGKDASGTNYRLLSGPVKRRGKEREIPKAKKPSSLRKIILSERESRREKFLRDVLSGNVSSRVMNFMPAAQSLVVDNSIPNDDDLTEELAGSLSSPSARKALLLSRIHSRRFREYCNQMLSKDIDTCCTQLLQELVRFQDRLFHKDPVKAKMRRRYVLGLREVSKHLKLHKLKCIVISPNLERVQSKGGLDDALHGIITECQKQEVPFVFALSRKALGKACARKVPVSVVGIFNYEGAEQHFHRLRDLTDEARQAYAEMVSTVEIELSAHLADIADASVAELRSRSPSATSLHSMANSEPAICTELLSDVETAATRAYYSEGEFNWSNACESDDDDEDDDDCRRDDNDGDKNYLDESYDHSSDPWIKSPNRL